MPTDADGNVMATPTPVPTIFSVDRNDLQAPRFVNWSLGLERKLPKAIYLKAEFLEKRGSRGFVYNTPTGSSGDFVLENTRDDRYDAFELTLRHNFRESYMLMGSYTRSRDHSNQALDFNVDSPLLSAQQPGPYPWDTPNRFLTWGYIPLFKLPIVHQTEIAWSSELRTGFPFNVTNDQQQLVGPPGSQRFPEYFSLNLQLEKRFHLFGYYWALRGGFDNITNRANPYVVNNDINSPQFLTFSAFQGRAIHFTHPPARPQVKANALTHRPRAYLKDRPALLDSKNRANAQRSLTFDNGRCPSEQSKTSTRRRLIR